MHRGKVDPGVSELPRGNELSRGHVNRPLHEQIMILLFSSFKVSYFFEFTFLEFHFETEAKVDFPSACI